MDQKFELYRGKKSTLSGPNCHNFVLYLLGLAAGLHYESEESINALRTSSYCKELSVDEELKKGDLGLIFYDEETLAHSFIFKDQESAYQKASFYNMFAYEETKLAPMYKFFGIIEGYKLSSYLKVFRCRPLEDWPEFHSLSHDALIFRAKVEALEGEFTKVAFNKDTDLFPKFIHLEKQLELIKSEIVGQKSEGATVLAKLLELKIKALEMQIERWQNPDEDD